MFSEIISLSDLSLNDSISYHPSINSFLCKSNDNISLINFNDQNKCISFPISSISEKKLIHHQEDLKKPEKLMNSLRFSKGKSPNIYIPPNQLSAISLSHSENLVIGNMSFSKGVHFWEIICPLSCSGISIGVIKEGEISKSPTILSKLTELISFRTSTPRIISVKLDLNSGIIKFWIDGNLNEGKTKKIHKGNWFPCVKIKEEGNFVILNPYVFDIERPYLNFIWEKNFKKIVEIKTNKKKNRKSNEKNTDFLKNTSKNWLVLRAFNPKIKTKEELNQIFPINCIKCLISANFFCFFFEDFIIKQNFIKIILEKEYLIAEKLIIIEEKVFEEIMETSSPFNNSQPEILGVNFEENLETKLIFLTFFKENFDFFTQNIKNSDNIIDSVNNIMTLLSNSKEKLLIKNGNSLKTEFEMIYLEKSQNLLIKFKNHFKLIRKNMNNDYKINFSLLFSNKIKSQTDKILISIELFDINYFINWFDFPNFLLKMQSIPIKERLCEFLLKIEKKLINQKKTQFLTLKFEYNRIKLLIECIIFYLNNELNELRGVFNEEISKKEKETIKNSRKSNKKNINLDQAIILSQSFLINILDDSSDCINDSKKIVTIDILTYLLSIFLKLDDNLNIISHFSNEKSKKYQINSLYTSFDRLSSFLNTPFNEKIQMAELGLFNKMDFLIDIRHFEQINSQLYIKNNDFKSELYNSMPKNRLISNYNSINIELSNTINSFPYQTHEISNDLNEKFQMETNENSHYMVSFSINGDIIIWNTELALFKAFKFNIFEKNNKKTSYLQKEKDFEFNKLLSNKTKIIEPSEQILKKPKILPPILIKDKEKPKEIGIIPDLNILKELISMGFNPDSSKKALIKVKNSGISAAIDLLINNVEDLSVEKPEKIDISPWICSECTYLNNKCIDQCEICLQNRKIIEEINVKNDKKQEDLEFILEKIVNESDQDEKSFKSFNEENINFEKENKILKNLFFCKKNDSLAGIIVGNVVKNNNQLFVKLFRIGIKTDILGIFYSKINNFYVNNINKECIFSDKIHDLEKNLFENNFFSVLQSFYPVFYGISEETLQIYGENEFNLNSNSQIIDFNTKQINENNFKVAFLLKNNDNTISLSIYLIVLSIENMLDYNKSLENSLIFNEKIDCFEPLYIFLNDENIILVETNQIKVYNIKINDSVKILNCIKNIEFPIKINKIQNFNENKTFFITTQDFKSFFINFDENFNYQSKNIKEFEEKKLDLNFLNPENLNEKSINLIKNLFKTEKTNIFTKINYCNIPYKLENNSSIIKFAPNISENLSLKCNLNLTPGQKQLKLEFFVEKLISDQKLKKKISINSKLYSYYFPEKSNKISQISSEIKENCDLFKKSIDLIPIKIKSHTGACYNYNFCPSQLLFPSSEPFLTNYPKSCFIFQHLYEKPMYITQIIIHSFIESKWNSYPIGSGLIFTSDYVSDFQENPIFNNMKSKEYKYWLKNKNLNEFKTCEPVGCFEFIDNSTELICEIDFKRIAKFIMIKVTGFRTKPFDFTSKFNNGEALGIEFLGVKGICFDFDCNSERINMKDKNIIENKNDFLNNVKLFNNGNEIVMKNIKFYEYLQLDFDDNCGIQDLINLNSEELNGIPLSVKFEINSDIIIDNYNGLELEIIEKKSDWKIFGLKIDIFNNKNNEIQEFKQKFNCNYIQNLINENLNINKRRILCKIIVDFSNKNKEFIDILYEKIDFNLFIRINILQETESPYIFFDFLRLFTKKIDFSSKLTSDLMIILRDLAKIAIKISFIGLKAFFSLLQFIENNIDSTIFIEILEILRLFAYKYKENRSQNYNILQIKYKIPCLSLEKELFSLENLYLLEKEEKNNFEFPYFNEKPLKNKILYHANNYNFEFLVDLLEFHKINSIFLFINKSLLKSKMRIIIKNIDHNENNIIFDEFIPDHLFLQMANYSYNYKSDQKYSHFLDFKFSNFLNVYKINKSFIGKYIKINCIFNFNLIKNPSENIPDYKENPIFPIFFGEIDILHKTNNTTNEFNNIFSVKNMKKTDLIDIYKLKIQKYELENSDFTLFFETLGISQKYENNSSNELITKKGNKIKKSILSVQSELIQLLYSHSTVLSQITDTCLKIEKLHLSLLKLSNYEENSFYDLNSLDFLTTIIKKTVIFLKKIDSKSSVISSWRHDLDYKESKGMLLSMDLFEIFIVNDYNSTVSKEILDFLINLLIDNLSDHFWQELIILIVIRFLSDNLNSHKPFPYNISPVPNIINALDLISIPNFELLCFLAQKLGLINKKTNNNSIIRDCDESLLIMTTSILILLKKGFEKIGENNHFNLKNCHFCSFCKYCKDNRFICGVRFKCLNCENVDCCENCSKKHCNLFKNHVFLHIDRPLPLFPEENEGVYIRNRPILNKVLEFETPLTNLHNKKCENCSNLIEGNLYLCVNCEDFNICEKCYKNKIHIKFHFFAEIPYKIIENYENTPKILISVLNPLLYPQKLSKKSENIQLERKRSLKKSSEITNNRFKSLDFSKKEIKTEKTQSFSNLDEKIKCKKLDYEDLLIICMKINSWFNKSEISEYDKISILTIGIDLFYQILKLCNLKGILFVLQQYNLEFIKLFLFVLKLNSLVLKEKFLDILSFLSLRGENFEKKQKLYLNNQLFLQEKQSAEKIKLIIICFLRSILEWSLDYVLCPGLKTLYLENFENLPINIWQDHIYFLLEQYLRIKPLVFDENKGNKTDLAVKNQRKNSEGLILSINKEKNSFNFDFSLEKTQFLPINIARNLLILLDSNIKLTFRQNYNISSNVNLWKLSLQSLLRVEMSELIKGKIFKILMNSFKNANEEIQQIISEEVLNFTEKIISNTEFEKEFCDELLTIIFDTIFYQEKDHIIYSLIIGWLDILLTKKTPKPKEYYQNEIDICFCKLNLKGIMNLLRNISEYLKKQANFGGLEGVLISSDLIITRLNVAKELIKMLVLSENHLNCLAIQELFINYNDYKDEIRKSFKNLLEWYTFNKISSDSTHSINSPSMNLLKLINDYLNRFFKIASDYEEISLIFLEEILSLSKESDISLWNLSKNNEISLYNSLYYSKMINIILEELFDIFIKSDYIASETAFSLKGFEYLLDRIGIIKEADNKESKITNSILLNSSLYDYIQLSSKPLQDQLLEKTEKEIINLNMFKTEEFASKISILNLEGQIPSNLPTDWSLNKKGAKSKVFSFQLTNEFYNEYSLILEIDKICEIKQLIIGFNCVLQESNDKIIGVPESILLEGGISLENLEPLGTLEHINDEGYSNSSVKVFIKNFQRFNLSNSNEKIEEKLRFLNLKKIKFIKFRFKRPIVTFIENYSILKDKNYKNIDISISFLSISGFEYKQQNNINLKIMEEQRIASVNLLAKLCNIKFEKTLECLAHKLNLIDKIKQNFENLIEFLCKDDKNISILLLAIARNQEMGDFIINFFMNNGKELIHSKIIKEIIINEENKLNRIKILFMFIFGQISIFLTNKNPDYKFIREINFIPFLIDCLLEIIENVYENSMNYKGLLEFELKEIINLLNFYENKSSENHFKNAIIQLLVTLLHLNKENTDNSLLNICINEIWSRVIDGKTLYFYLLSSLLIGFSGKTKFLLEKNNEKIDYIINNIFSYLKYDQNIDKILLKCNIELLNSALICEESIKNYLINSDFHVKLYLLLKTNNYNSIINELLDEELLSILIDLLVKVIIDKKQSTSQLISLLLNDVQLLSSKKDIIFMQKVLYPILTTESTIPICFHPLKNPKKSHFKNDIDNKIEDNNDLNSKLLSQIQKQSFYSAFYHMANKTSFISNLTSKQLIWNLKTTQNEDCNPLLGQSIFNNILKNGPFLILIEGTNQGKTCLVGVFSSQSIENIPFKKTNIESNYKIPFSEDSFIFYYEDEMLLNFEFQTKQTDFGVFESGNSSNSNYYGLSFSYNGKEVIFLSYIKSMSSYIDFNPFNMDVFNGKKQNIRDIPVEFIFKKAEFWNLKFETRIQEEKINENQIIIDGLAKKWLDKTNLLNYYRLNNVFMVPSSLTLDKLNDFFFEKNSVFQIYTQTQEFENISYNTPIYDLWIKNKNNNYILDLSFNQTDNISQKSATYLPNLTLLEEFNNQGGINTIIESIIKSLVNWKNKNRANKWFIWVKELSSFSNIPHYFSFMMKDKDCIDLLFCILLGLPDDDFILDQKKFINSINDQNLKKYLEEKLEQKIFLQKSLFNKNSKGNNITNQNISSLWEEQENKAVKFSYNIIKEVFKADTDSKIRYFVIESDLIDCILERISLISKEEKRKYCDKIEIEPEQIAIQRENSENNDKIVKKKGVGYASDSTGQNQKWNVSEYQETQKTKSEQLQSLLSILLTFLDIPKEWNPPEILMHKVFSSALFPLLESAFRSGSLLDMSKDFELFKHYLDLAVILSKHSDLIECLLDIDPHYQPKQSESIYQLLINIKDLSNIFLNCLTNDPSLKQSNDQATILAHYIITSFNQIKLSIDQYENIHQSLEDSSKLNSILDLPIAEKYRILLKDLRFDYLNMKEASGKYKHHYSANISISAPSQTKMIRLAQELADLSTALPIEHTNSIFVRVDESRVDLMKAVIMGSAGTPYAHGAFEYDIYFDETYPNSPPKVNLETTGYGKVRFNPNLYSCGKVCLSLLGTWRGSNSENWDPKISTLLQVLMSLQAIIMSEDVYFNEPGFEGEAATEEGIKKNEGYSNIVRYCNVKFAMIEQLKNPSKGFETVIKRHFYLKKDIILEECDKWLKDAQNKNATYIGLVNDHNTHWAGEFKKKKDQYYNMLNDAVKELKILLNNLQPPSNKDLLAIKPMKKTKITKKIKEKKIVSEINLNEIDVSYPTKQDNEQNLSININDDKVKDRWSRYIGAMGIESIAKQSEASVFLEGLSPLGIEIAKNIILSGVKKFTIYDKNNTSYKDLAGQFFLNETDVGINRAIASLNKLQELNYYVKIDIFSNELSLNEDYLDKIGLKNYTIVIMTEEKYSVQRYISQYCRKRGIKFISCEARGVYARIFNDFGEEFLVLDKNGEENNEIMIKNIDKNGEVDLIQGTRHNLEDNDIIEFRQVEEEQIIPPLKSFNNSVHKVKIINSNRFKIENIADYTKYIGNGIAKKLKIPLKMKFESFESVFIDKKYYLDSNLSIYDFDKIKNQDYLCLAFSILNEYRELYDKLPNIYNKEDKQKYLELSKSLNNIITPELTDFLSQFCNIIDSNLPPLSAFFGGLVSQEILKAITQKYTPINQSFYCDFTEVLSIDPKEIPSNEIIKSKSYYLSALFGESLLNSIQNCKLFMVGAGAIGCELLKNYAMIDLATGKSGEITLTDPDVIEMSNLNRQFLFREKHLRKPKSAVAAAASIQMNPSLKGHIIARLDKVHEQTEFIFNDKFFENLNIVTNALDNVPARRYVDSRCVNNKIPLIESGTLGPKGHIQVILPYLTESYNSQEDPKEDGEIPHCTLKMFPEETLHCVEWARDKFGKLFFQEPSNLKKIIEEKNQIGVQDYQNLEKAVLFLKKIPRNFENCVEFARKKFEKYFVKDIKQLIYTYPLDMKTKEGTLFWSLPKRPPIETIYNKNNILHASVISSLACLKAVSCGIKLPANNTELRNLDYKLKIANIADNFKFESFIANNEKSKKLNLEISKEDNEDNLEEKFQLKLKEFNDLLMKYKDINLIPQDFEKDNDLNFHIDLIYSLANSRSENYKLESMDWITVKLKAGKIIPALATTTAAIAGLQTIELIKILKKCQLNHMKNGFINLAIPIIQFSEPAKANITKINENLSITLWDRWEIKSDLKKKLKIKDLIQLLKEKYLLVPKDIIHGNKLIFMSGLYNGIGKEKEKLEILEKNLFDIVNFENDNENFVDLTITFSKNEINEEILQNLPIVRVYFI